MSTWSHSRALARIEIRELHRHPARSLLVLSLIAIPVAALVGGSTLARITRPTLKEQRTETFGRATLRIEDPRRLEAIAVLELLPPELLTEPVFLSSTHVHVPGRRLAAQHIGLDLKGLAEGILVLQEGRPPVKPRELAISPNLMQSLHLQIGGTVHLGDPNALHTVVGTVADPEALDRPLVLAAPEHFPDSHPAYLLAETSERRVSRAIEGVSENGFLVTARHQMEDTRGFEDAALFVLAGFGFVEAALVISAAFAVSLRRRQREIGLLGSAGASPRGITASLLASAVILATLGAFLGITVGLGVAALLHPHLDQWNGRLNGPFETSPIHVAGACALGLAASIAAATIPARGATRLPIRIALSGRRPPVRGSGKWVLVGTLLVALALALMVAAIRARGLTATLSILAAAVCGVLGFGALSPWLLEQLARFAAPLPLSWRLAVRDAGRFRSRNGPVVTAVLAGMAISVTIAVMLTSLEPLLAGRAPSLRDDQILLTGPAAEECARELARELPVTARAPLSAVYSDGQIVSAALGDRSGFLVVGDASLLRALGYDSGEQALSEGRIVSAGKQLELRIGDRTLETSLQLAPLVPDQPTSGPIAVIGRERLASQGWAPGPPPRQELTPWLLRLRRPVTEEDVDLASVVAARSVSTTVDAAVLHASPRLGMFRIALLLSMTTGLIIIFVATALTSMESAADAAVLHAVGAAPALLRRHTAARAGYLAFLGCVLSIPAGLIPAAGLLPQANVNLAFSLPWPEIAATLIGLPLVAYASTWLVAALRRPRHPRWQPAR
ncbi:MAG: ABC transporter permease [Planctomycetota bacterium]